LARRDCQNFGSRHTDGSANGNGTVANKHEDELDTTYTQRVYWITLTLAICTLAMSLKIANDRRKMDNPLTNFYPASLPSE
jgi:hypothetical protein